MDPPSCFVAQIDLSHAFRLEKDLKEQGFVFSRPQYTLFCAKKKGVSCTLYKSGKLLVQGKDKGDFITFYLEPNILGELNYSYPHASLTCTPHIGVDESGKGDLFGPLVIGSVFADQKGAVALAKMGAQDSKKMSDGSITKCAKQIRDQFPFALVTISPQKYNVLYGKFKNLNRLLGWGHAKAIEEILQKTRCKKVTIDQFAAEHVVEFALKQKGVDVELTQKHRGEEDIVVAAASILARAAFIEGIDELSRKFQVKLPKGATNIALQAGRMFVATHGRAMLPNVAKMHFKTVANL